MFSDSGCSNGYYHHQEGGAFPEHNSPRSPHRGRGRRRGRRGRSHDPSDAPAFGASRVADAERREEQKPPPCTDFDMAYFHSYAHLGIHEEMIKDRVRTDTYRAAIMRHQSSIAGKVVVDVGCGTGILSIFCAQAGAKRVYAVDASDIAVQANEVVKANNLSDTVIVLHGRVEDVEIDEEVDVIISEWMGYMLLYESMLGSVITARDRWLKPGGLILPSNATLYMAPVTHSDRYSDSIDFWRNVYGIDMSAMLPLAKQCAFEEPCIETISGENVLTWPHVVKHVDCYTVTLGELESVTTRYKFKSMMRESSNNQSADVSQRKKRANPSEALVLSTAPEDPPTHWQQTMVFFYDPIDLEQDQLIDGSLTLTQSRENRRFMNIHLEYTSGGRSFVKESVMR
ncbi:probable protein arginine N-methyltransferase 6 isoform X2 [Rhodamnia argentea]|uniref:Probable protein arginine N-methyltransferase 6 isoform X2 n=1 Tax=Rhodamnia argentea TaxID=178133 RepID=A0A8B8NL10_9MYRT|nr:probable protein arginine N-methyltransferase 6 isoform X2 [Rhodamnia argentea]